MRRRQLVLGAVTALVAVGAALLVANALGIRVAAGQAQSASQPRVAARLAGSAASGFSALSDRSLGAAPGAVLSDFQSLHAGNYADAKTVGNGMYLASNNGALCAWVRGGLGGCTDRLNAGDVWLAGDMIRESDSENAPFKVHFYGFARDDVAALRVTTADGTTRRIPVHNNAFQATFGNTSFGDLASISELYNSGRSVSVNPALYFAAHPPIAKP
jgi:hypothetical protein